MIAYLNGTIKHKDGKHLIVVCGQVGYQVAVPEYVLLESKIGQETELFTYQQISSRDESIELFGFQKKEEIDFFKQLISISGVGPRSAMGTLAVANVSELKKTISRGDPVLLTKVAGIGKKTAERIVVELKDKMDFDPTTADGTQLSDSDADVIEALQALGYKPHDIRNILRSLPKEAESSEDKIKAALRLLGGN